MFRSDSGERGRRAVSCGDVVQLRVTGVKPDGKLDLTAREKAYIQIDEDAEAVMGVIEEFEGVLPFNDKVSPEIIQRENLA